jgi:hypothetical protein
MLTGSRRAAKMPAASRGGIMRFALAILLLSVLALSACSNPCDRLLKKVCSCPGDRAKAACAEAKKRREMREKEALDKEKCRKALESFRCESLQ